MGRISSLRNGFSAGFATFSSKARALRKKQLVEKPTQSEPIALRKSLPSWVVLTIYYLTFGLTGLGVGTYFEGPTEGFVIGIIIAFLLHALAQAICDAITELIARLIIMVVGGVVKIIAKIVFD